MIKRLRHRSTAMITAILTIVMTVVCIVIYVSMYRSEEQRAERTIRAAMSVRLELPPMPPSEQDAPKSDPPEKDTSEKDTSEKDERRPGRPSSGEGFRPDVRFDRGGFFPAADPTRIGTGWVRIDIDDDGSIKGIFMSQRSSEDEDEFPAETAEEAVSRILASGTKEGKIIAGDVRYSYAYDEQRRAVVLLDRQNSISTLRDLAITLVVIYIGSVGVFFLIAVLLSRWMARPIEDAWNRQNVFFSNASHELKTPLAVITANLDVATSSPDKTVGEQSKWFGIIRDEADKMSGLIGEMLYLSREEHNEDTVMVVFDFSHETERACLAAEALCFENGKELICDIDPGINVKGDKESLIRAVHILLDNAVKHSPAGSEIHVTLKRAHKKCHLTVDNEGTIPEEDIGRIFDRYYRTDKSRSKDTGGYGLGLAIAKAVTEKHGGSISAVSKDGRTAFTITIDVKDK